MGPNKSLSLKELLARKSFAGGIKKAFHISRENGCQVGFGVAKHVSQSEYAFSTFMFVNTNIKGANRKSSLEDMVILMESKLRFIDNIKPVRIREIKSIFMTPFPKTKDTKLINDIDSSLYSPLAYVSIVPQYHPTPFLFDLLSFDKLDNMDTALIMVASKYHFKSIVPMALISRNINYNKFNKSQLDGVRNIMGEVFSQNFVTREEKLLRAIFDENLKDDKELTRLGYDYKLLEYRLDKRDAYVIC